MDGAPYPNTYPFHPVSSTTQTLNMDDSMGVRTVQDCLSNFGRSSFNSFPSPLLDSTKMLLASGDSAFDVVVSSTLRRALQSAELCMTPLKKDDSPLIALPKMAEIQCDDIWNEIRSQEQVQADWPLWSCHGGFVCESQNQLDSAQSLIQRAEYVWKELSRMPGSVIGVSAHGCLLFFLSRRIAAAQNRRLAPFQEEKWRNGEVRRQVLPAFDGRAMSWEEFGGFLHEPDFDFYNRYHRRVQVVNAARLRGSAPPQWTDREWRFARSDSEIDAEADIELSSFPSLMIKGWNFNNLLRCFFCGPGCLFFRPAKNLQA